MERTYRCKNGVVEKTRYHVGDNARPRGRKTGVTTPRQQEQNFNTAVRRLARLLNCNCTADKGLLVTLRFADEGIDKLRETAGDDPDKLRDAAEHQAMLWLRRLRPCRDGNPAPAGGTGRAMVIRGGSNTLIAIGISRTPMDGGHGRAVLACGGDCATTTRAGVDVEAVGVARPHWAKIRKMFGVDIAGIGGIRI